MSRRSGSNSRALLGRLRDTMASEAKGQERLDTITHLIADSMGTEVCSIYLFRDTDTLELCATEGLNRDAVHQTRMKLGEGLVGRVAKSNKIVNTADAPSAKGFRYMPETGEEIYSSFLGIPIQRLGEKLGVLVVQSKLAREFTSDEIYALEVVAMVIAEMTELGAFVGEETGLKALHQQAVMFRGATAQEGAAQGNVWLHEPRVVVTNLVTEDPQAEKQRLRNCVETLRAHIDTMFDTVQSGDKEQSEVLEAYKMFANSRGWMRRMETDIDSGLSAEAAVEKEQSTARARLEQATDAYMRDRLHDLDDLSNRLLRILTGQGKETGAEMPADPILIASNIGPAELLDYGRSLKGIVLEEGSVGSHATIVARALAIPLIIRAKNITTEALNGDRILVDGDQGIVHLRPDEMVANAFRDKIAMEAEAQERYSAIRDDATVTKNGTHLSLYMNAGLMADLPSLNNSGAEGVGLFRTELQFLVRSKMPQRSELSSLYKRVMDAADGKRVVFRTLDIGSDKVLSYLPHVEEPNPALGWRAIRVGLDRQSVLRMQLQALLRAAEGRPLSVMFPFVAQMSEFDQARAEMDKAIEREIRLGHPIPEIMEIGAMLETPSLAFAPKRFYETVDFLSIGGNDLKQFFFAADRENELVRRRYDTLNLSFLSFLQQISERCTGTSTRLSFCGEDAGRPVEAAAFAAIGIKNLSMRPASIGPVKHMLLRTNLDDIRDAIKQAHDAGVQSARNYILEALSRK
ncbi:MAG: phosphoenolpyruvate--protein phosphotransferase [Paracoccaceae bacterium]